MQTLGAVYVEALKAYWASPAYNNGVTSASKQDVYAEHLASQLQTDLRLLCADDTLPAASAAMLRQVLEHPAAAERQAAHPASPVKVLRVGIQDLRTHVGRKLASVVAFITDEADSASTGAVLYAPGHGISTMYWPGSGVSATRPRFKGCKARPCSRRPALPTPCIWSS